VLPERPQLRPALFLATLLALCAILPLFSVPQVAFAISGDKVQISGTRFAESDGSSLFLYGVNYEGPFDRAWLMWDNLRFDPVMIETDFRTAAKVGINTIRIFVQPQLRDSINLGDYGKLDTVIDLARRNNLYVLLTLQDYREHDLSAEANLAWRIASRYAGNPTMLGYDLRNEPNFGELVAARYPVGADVPLQSDEVLRVYGERHSQQYVNQYRATQQGASEIPEYMSSRQAYYFKNAMRLWDEFQQTMSNWLVSHGGRTPIEFLESQDATPWQPFYQMLNRTVQSWIDVRQNAIHNADSRALVTVGWNNPILARLPANSRLNFISFHNFPGEGYEGLTGTLTYLEQLKTAFPQQPVVLEEFGYSNLRFDGSSVPQTRTASYETAIWLYLHWRGFAGGYKWMLNNFPPSFNRFEAGLGLLDDEGRPKLSYYALRGITGLDRNTADKLNLNGLQPAGVEIVYTFTASGSLLTNALESSSGPLSYRQEQLSPFAAIWKDSGNELLITVTSPSQVTVNINSMFPRRDKSRSFNLVMPDGKSQVMPDSPQITLNLQPGLSYLLTQASSSQAQTAQPLAGKLYFPETGHNLGGAFRTYWEQQGGLPVFGFPLTEEFQELNQQDGKTYIVQYFERARFEYHPENKGTAYEVLLGHLGRTVTAGRESETPFRRLAGPVPGRLYYKESGHTLGGTFQSYWERNGGLFMFGFPISEEFNEINPQDNKTYRVQYFERARFEYHPENSGTKFEVLLGHLGKQVLASKS
jgi:hypothetical protein